MRHEKKGNVHIYHLTKLIPDNKMSDIMNTTVKPSQIKLIIRENADAYDENGKLLLRFRKGALSNDHTTEFYDNVIKFAHTVSTNRGNTTVEKLEPVMSNVIGYFDRLGPKQKYSLKIHGYKLPMEVRETYFNAKYPEQFKHAVPLIRDIDRHYQKQMPEQYALQKRKARQTPFHIADTAFTTVTLNVNFRTTIHTDKGDDAEGFGNLAVIEQGKYTGAETCFPQYGVGVDVRTGDLLFMNVHEPHGNLPIHLGSPDAKRLSIVCYLRTNIWKKTKGMSRARMEKHLRVLRKITHKQHLSGNNRKTRKQ